MHPHTHTVRKERRILAKRILIDSNRFQMHHQERHFEFCQAVPSNGCIGIREEVSSGSTRQTVCGPHMWTAGPVRMFTYSAQSNLKRRIDLRTWSESKSNCGQWSKRPRSADDGLPQQFAQQCRMQQKLNYTHNLQVRKWNWNGKRIPSAQHVSGIK